ncbi:unnamed protein product [Durusdinium trenchii]|uniref:KHDC4/BBP-like KH-domain type I domain-containing protein n=1 Tax=Durusdinium trenchii TaxID=1381693 RepID=A0ABP0L3F9_9DINO
MELMTCVKNTFVEIAEEPVKLRRCKSLGCLLEVSKPSELESKIHKLSTKAEILDSPLAQLTPIPQGTQVPHTLSGPAVLSGHCAAGSTSAGSTSAGSMVSQPSVLPTSTDARQASNEELGLTEAYSCSLANCEPAYAPVSCDPAYGAYAHVFASATLHSEHSCAQCMLPRPSMPQPLEAHAFALSDHLLGSAEWGYPSLPNPLNLPCPGYRNGTPLATHPVHPNPWHAKVQSLGWAGWAPCIMESGGNSAVAAAAEVATAALAWHWNTRHSAYNASTRTTSCSETSESQPKDAHLQMTNDSNSSECFDEETRSEVVPLEPVPVLVQKPSRSQRAQSRRWCCINIRMHFDRTFHPVRMIIGKGGDNTRRIALLTGAKVRVRGRGSGHLEPATGQEAPTPLMVVVSSDSENTEGYFAALSMSIELLEEVRTAYVKNCQWTGTKAMAPAFVAGSMCDFTKTEIRRPRSRIVALPCLESKCLQASKSS